jgi:hypothetical protein
VWSHSKPTLNFMMKKGQIVFEMQTTSSAGKLLGLPLYLPRKMRRDIERRSSKAVYQFLGHELKWRLNGAIVEPKICQTPAFEAQELRDFVILSGPNKTTKPFLHWQRKLLKINHRDRIGNLMVLESRSRTLLRS